MEKYTIIFDTTLRDGDQAPKFRFGLEGKIAMARQLAKLGVNVIEAGFAASSPEEMEALQRICIESNSYENKAIICSLARATCKDIEAAASALEKAERKRIHTFVGTSDIHIKEKFGKDRKWVLDTTYNMVNFAKRYFSDIEFSCEDFGRTDLDFAVQVIEAAVKSGASTINLPDTVGFLLPHEMYQKVNYVITKSHERGLYPVFSVHCHNDLGNATANTISGLMAGATQAQVTMNGIGERAGNAALEEVIANIMAKEISSCSVNPKLIRETSELCSKITGVYPQPNKAIVGINAFSHEAGIHTSAVIKNPETYESIKPEDYGYERTIVLGSRSGKAGIDYKAKQLGYSFNTEHIEALYLPVKNFADNHKGEIKDENFIEIVKTVLPENFHNL
jgi:2-isopropylmalate synthase